MQTQLAPAFANTPEGQEAQAILRKCVHCGFCTATCPTYQTLGDELDGPRGRIYLIKQVLEGHPADVHTQQHLDRCLSCRNCETTCPSGVQYGHLLDIGRAAVQAQVPRPWPVRVQRWLLKTGMTSPAFAPAVRVGRWVRGVLPQAWASKLPTAAHMAAGAWPTRRHTHKVLLLQGCVHGALRPNIHAATARVLDACGIQTEVVAQAGCCGAVHWHLDDVEAARAQMRRNIDAWWPLVDGGQAQAIVSNASGCSVQLKDYGHALQHDAAYAAKAARISALAHDISTYVAQLLPTLAQLRQDGLLRPPAQPMLYHPPCTLQHGLRSPGVVEAALHQLGFVLHTARTEAHLCCGSAGTYALLQPALSHALRTRKIAALEAVGEAPDAALLTANIGCITHLQAGTSRPVLHWIEALDAALRPRRREDNLPHPA